MKYYTIFKSKNKEIKMRGVFITIVQVVILSFILSKPVTANNSETTENIYGRLTALQCDSLIKANETNPNFVILDVRTPAEWNSYHIMGSINRSTGLTDFTAQLDALPKKKIFLLHCQSGGRSAGAFAKMKELKFTEVYEMIGGINSWNSYGLPTTKITEPKLMLVSYNEILSRGSSDTINVTVTNRANGNLTFKAVNISDIHGIINNFNSDIALDGAQDYTFSIIHSPGYSGDESTKISMESNGGKIDLEIQFKNGTIVGIAEQAIAEITVYPNPANQKLYFKHSGLDYFDQISVINLVGQKVINESQLSVSNGIDVSHLKNGIYLLQIKKGNLVKSEKFIVKH